MTLYLELMANGHWRTVGTKVPSDFPGFMSNRASGKREVLAFADQGPTALIGRSLYGPDHDNGERRTLISQGIEPIVILEDGDVYDFQLQTDRMTHPARFRFRHSVSDSKPV
jgi:hypothetical protein